MTTPNLSDGAGAPPAVGPPAAAPGKPKLHNTTFSDDKLTEKGQGGRRGARDVPRLV